MAIAFVGLDPAFGQKIPKGDITIGLELVASGLTAPVYATNAGDGSGRLFVVDQAGLIRIVDNGELLEEPFLDLTDRIVEVNPGFDERGLLGLAFHPNYADNGRFFVRYSAPRTHGPLAPCVGTSRGCHEEVVAEFKVSKKDPNKA
ncbi:MAG: PQQ-dependent sugar dehydrogenase, partial [Planctomycetes bacterium]|nr:PQQ-dependent sugar dehydrogenase [Planctomycetota bacterium]